MGGREDAKDGREGGSIDLIFWASSSGPGSQPRLQDGDGGSDGGREEGTGSRARLQWCWRSRSVVGVRVCVG